MHIVGLIFIRTGSNLVIFGVIFGALSYMRTQRFRARTGVNPWGIPPVVWGVGSFFIAIFGTLLSLIACATTKVPGGGRPGFGGYPGSGTGRGQGQGRGFPPGYGTPPGYGAPPGYGGQPAYGAHPAAGSTSGFDTAPAYPGDGAPAPAPAPGTGTPSWHPDPTGRHHHRYWDGSQWTHHVSDSGSAALDPI